jgi:hypothetical protein
MVPDEEKEPVNIGRASTLDFARDHQLDHLGLLKLPQRSTTALSRLDIPRSVPHILADTTTTIIGASPHYTHRQKEGPWLPDVPRSYVSPQEMPAPAIPRISSRSSIPRMRESNSTEQSQRPVDDWTRSQRSYPTLSSLSQAPGHLHTAPGIDLTSEFARVKHEPEGDSSIPPLRLGWAYETRPPPPANMFVSAF